MAIAKKELEKPTEIKTAKVETPKTEAKKTGSAKKEEPPKTIETVKKDQPENTVSPVNETAASKSAAEKKAVAAKKSTVKKTDIKTNVVVEFGDKQIDSKDIIAAAKKAFTKANKGIVIKTLDIYVKPEENVAYYVVNGQGSEDYRVNL